MSGKRTDVLVNLLFLTSNFPYHPGEQFIEGEIGILSQYFKKILILPLHNRTPNNIPPRPVPENVEILLLPQDLPIHNKRQTALKTDGLCSIKDLVTAAGHSKIIHPLKLYGLCLEYFSASLFSTLISQRIRFESYGIIYSYWGATNGLILYFLKKKCSNNRIFVSRVHNYDLYAERQGLKRLPFQKNLLETCDMVSPDSEQGEIYLKHRYRNGAKNVRHFHLGVSTQNIINSGSADDILRIVTCSFIVPVKRLELLIAALMHVSRKVIWTHIGDGQEKDKICQFSRNLPKNIQTIFLGHLENKALLNYYRSNPVDLFVNVSSYEGIPVSIMEALSFGIEPVATDVGGVSELVKSKFGTLLSPEFQPELLADILQKHHNSQVRRIKAQDHQRHNFSFANYQCFASELLALSRKKNIED